MIIGADDTRAIEFTVVVSEIPDGEDSGWSVTITAAPRPGYEFPADADTRWTFTGSFDCLDSTSPATPRLVCEGGFLAVGVERSAAYDYDVIGDLGATGGQQFDLTVVATPAQGYEFPTGTVTEWTFAGIVDCTELGSQAPAPISLADPSGTPALQLPRTGASSTSLMLTWAAITMALGLVLMLVRCSTAPATR